jgi:Ran GTPase-activating protein 1
MTSILSIHGQGLKLNTRADIEPILRDADPTLVEEVHFGGNTIGVEAAEAVAEFLARTTRLKVLDVLFAYWSALTSRQIADFADIFTGRLITEIPQALSAICDALKSKTSLVEINLSDNAFGGRSVDPMVPFLTHNRSFSVLKLNNNGLGPAGGTVVASALLESAKLSEAAGEKSNLKVVICGRNRLEDGSAPTWAEAFAAHGTLEHVSMPQNGIRQDGMTALARSLAKNTGLRILELQDNAVNVDESDGGTKAFADALPHWPKLEKLDFSDCVLAQEGEVPAILAVLAKGGHAKLRTLQLQNNNLGADSFTLIADEVLGKLPALQRLELQWNEVEDDDEAAETLKEAMIARGGKLVMNDEEDEEEKDADKDEEAAEEPEPEQVSTTQATVPAPAPASTTSHTEAGAKHELEPAPTMLDKAADALADLMGKVSLGN